VKTQKNLKNKKYVFDHKQNAKNLLLNKNKVNCVFKKNSLKMDSTKNKIHRTEMNFQSNHKKKHLIKPQFEHTIHKELNTHEDEMNSKSKKIITKFSSNKSVDFKKYSIKNISKSPKKYKAIVKSPSPQRTASKQLELLIRNDKKKTSHKQSKSPETRKWKLNNMIKNTSYSKSLASSFNSNHKLFAKKKKLKSKYKSVIDEDKFLNYSNSRGNNPSFSNEAKNKQNINIKTKVYGTAMSMLNLKEDACKFLDKDLISRENQTLISIKKLEERDNKIKANMFVKGSNKKPRGQDLLYKIGQKSKSPEDKFKSQETKKYQINRKITKPQENVNFSSGKTVDGVVGMVELSELKERIKLKKVKDIIEQNNDDLSLESSELYERENYEPNYETEKINLCKNSKKVDHNVNNFENKEISNEYKFQTYQNKKSSKKMKKRKYKKKFRINSMSGNNFNKIHFEVKSKSRNSSLFKKKFQKLHSWTDRKEKMKRKNKKLKYKKKINNKSILFDRKINYSRISLNFTEVIITLNIFTLSYPLTTRIRTKTIQAKTLSLKILFLISVQDRIST
jgi:hypothetical protein